MIQVVSSVGDLKQYKINASVESSEKVSGGISLLSPSVCNSHRRTGLMTVYLP